MKKIKLIFLIPVLLCLQNQSSYAQVFNILEPGDQHVYFGLGIDPVSSFTAGYARSFDLELIDRGLTIAGDVTLPFYLLDMEHYLLKLFSRIKIINFSNWHILNRLSVLYSGTDNALYFSNNVSLDETLLIGNFVKRWHVCGEIGYTKFLYANINHNKWYKSTHFSEAQNGWYSSTGGNFTFGIHGGYKFKDTIEATLRLLIRRTEKLNAIEGPPFYGNLGVNFYF